MLFFKVVLVVLLDDSDELLAEGLADSIQIFELLHADDGKWIFFDALNGTVVDIRLPIHAYLFEMPSFLIEVVYQKLIAEVVGVECASSLHYYDLIIHFI